MESYSGETSLHRLWSRRLAGQYEDDKTYSDLFDNNIFPSAQLQVENGNDKALSSSSCKSPCLGEDGLFNIEGSSKEWLEDIDVTLHQRTENIELPVKERLTGVSYEDIPCTYTVPKCQAHEMTAVGVCIDPRILPGFNYKIRTLSFEKFESNWLFNGEPREIESIGRGYSRRITLKPVQGNINKNDDYFWTDSNAEGFAFSIQVLKVQDKFTLFDADRLPVGHVEITALQGHQTELSQTVKKTGCIEKMVRVNALCKIDWFHELENNQIIPLSGTCICKREERKSGEMIMISDAKLGQHYGFTLYPGICSSLRSLRISSTKKSDIPTSYTIIGIETYHLPVIGTFVDDRILPGFYYKVHVGSCGKKLFGDKALKLTALGRGYAKRLTFSQDQHFWSDSYPEGFGFEISAVRNGMKFTINTKDSGSVLGQAVVFRDDCGPQIELDQSTVEDETGSIGIMKKVQIDVKCIIELELPNKEEPEHHTMRISGIATLFKPYKQDECEVMMIEDIGLESQLNILFMNQWQQLIFFPLNKTSY